jgi:hypothetical protein
MGRKLGLIGLAVIVCFVVGGLAATASPDISHPQTIHLIAITTEQNALDLGASGFSQGDEFIFHDVLKNHDGKRVGDDGGVCTITSLALQQANCQVTLSLPGGQIATQGLSTHGVTTFSVPVTGGSGVYRNVRGELVVHQVSATKALVTLELIP